jgi:hypothetical protein
VKVAKFPDNGNFDAETGLFETASTTNESQFIYYLKFAAVTLRISPQVKRHLPMMDVERILYAFDHGPKQRHSLLGK